MFGRLGFAPNEYYRMSFLDVIDAIDGYNDAHIDSLNHMRHIMWASLAAQGYKQGPKSVLPLPIDKAEQVEEAMSKEQFMNLAKMYKNIGRA